MWCLNILELRILHNNGKLFFCFMSALITLNSAYNKKKYLEILLHYRWLFVKGNVFIGEWHVFGAEVFLHYSRFFVKGNFVIGRVECIISGRSISSLSSSNEGNLLLSGTKKQNLRYEKYPTMET